MEKPRDNFKWFGEGFDGFPKILPEDCVEYAIYIIDTRLNDLEKRIKLRQIQDAGLKLTSRLTKGFIWQRERFDLILERDEGQSFLRGRTNFGDSVEDEWLVVYILRELSKEFPEVWIRVVDTDGQFLLIEAAGVLPRWLNPEIADFRVWLNNGKILIIPIDAVSNDLLEKVATNALSLKESLRILQNHRSKLIDSPPIQAEAFYRLQKYPEHILDSLHHAIVRLPRELAYILHDNPAHISPAVEAFYLRDPIALRPLQSQDFASLVFSPDDLVRMSVTFTKVGYAQLKNQQFDPPKAWAEALRFKDDLRSQVQSEIGMKLSCGFEMLVRDPQHQDSKAVREIKLLLDDLQADASLLPSNADLHNWGLREDDEGWLDIDFEDFEKELGGNHGSSVPGAKGGFGDKGTQENLRKMAARFEAFLNDDDAASVEGAEWLDDVDDMGDDDDDDEEEEDSITSDESEFTRDEKGVTFDEAEFTSMMREMMGMSFNNAVANGSLLATSKPVNSIPSNEDSDQACREDMVSMENELREAGALDLDLKQDYSDVSMSPHKGADNQSSGTDQATTSLITGKDQDNGDVEIDYNLAKNLLKTLQSQGGVSGPRPNFLEMLGTQVRNHEEQAD